MNLLIHNILNAFSAFPDCNYIITNNRRFNSWKPVAANDYLFFRDTPESGNMHTRKQLIKKVLTDISKRQKILKLKKARSFNHYYSLNLWNEIKLGYSFLLIDDVWDLITSKPASLGLSLIRILMYGPAVGIHTIMASGISYRNLLQQLISINPTILTELQNKYGIPEPKQINLMGDEIIFTPDDLIFFKQAGKMEMERLFK